MTSQIDSSATFDTIDLPPEIKTKIDELPVNQLPTDSSSTQKKTTQNNIFFGQQKIDEIRNLDHHVAPDLRNRDHEKFITPLSAHSLNNSQPTSGSQPSDDYKNEIDLNKIKSEKEGKVDSNEKKESESLSEIKADSSGIDLSSIEAEEKKASSPKLVDTAKTDEVDVVKVSQPKLPKQKTPTAVDEKSPHSKKTSSGLSKKVGKQRLFQGVQPTDFKEKKELSEFEKMELSYVSKVSPVDNNVSSLTEEKEKPSSQNVKELFKNLNKKKGEKASQKKRMENIEKMMEKKSPQTTEKDSQKKSGSQKKLTQPTSSDEVKMKIDEKMTQVPVKYEDNTSTVSGMEIETLAEYTKKNRTVGKKSEVPTMVVDDESEKKAMKEELKVHKEGNGNEMTNPVEQEDRMNWVKSLGKVKEEIKREHVDEEKKVDGIFDQMNVYVKTPPQRQVVESDKTIPSSQLAEVKKEIPMVEVVEIPKERKEDIKMDEEVMNNFAIENNDIVENNDIQMDTMEDIIKKQLSQVDELVSGVSKNPSQKIKAIKLAKKEEKKPTPRAETMEKAKEKGKEKKGTTVSNKKEPKKLLKTVEKKKQLLSGKNSMKKLKEDEKQSILAMVENDFEEKKKMKDTPKGESLLSTLSEIKRDEEWEDAPITKKKAGKVLMDLKKEQPKTTEKVKTPLISEISEIKNDNAVVIETRQDKKGESQKKVTEELQTEKKPKTQEEKKEDRKEDKKEKLEKKETKLIKKDKSGKITKVGRKVKESLKESEDVGSEEEKVDKLEEKLKSEKIISKPEKKVTTKGTKEVKTEKKPRKLKSSKSLKSLKEESSASKLKSTFTPYVPTPEKKKPKKSVEKSMETVTSEESASENTYSKELNIVKTSSESGNECYDIEKNPNNEKTTVFQGKKLETFIDQYQSARRVLYGQNTFGRKRQFPLYRRVPYYDFRWGMTIDDFPELKEEDNKWIEKFEREKKRKMN
ncbi:leucine-rich repeat-containing protein C10orf80, putative [Entamoeba invadens IP1]|uniref:Leucine-rich repeat-containing protein C10orf80, putative n=1 Tax=Entamoeba invadens IP1 TaxID=370355 RepID=A0A0A1UDA5_ENTIV|nr:leucine-rich repeat-containing protein C10orf80, putative [Entamoeba invadens IP1]ELP94403.1 leucine-rich repeat-containing protein C10orf80, putative [Entamoeba invadens IP1]|eukprot:XP_004261174.1 leucine-rich repeat-containing protein C10orf80, putative [Entamoeba invadens IP1]